VPAANALIAMPAECGGAAVFDRSEHFELCPRQRTTIAFDAKSSTARRYARVVLGE
jgi:hypothetical protein